MLAVIFERYIKTIIENFMLWTLIDQIANALAMYLLYDLLM